MTRVDEPAEAVGTAVAGLGGVREHAVVSPVPRAGELGDRHQLDGGDTERTQVVESLDDRVERARVGEGADVDLRDDEVGDDPADPLGIRPRELGVDDRRLAVHAVGLRTRRGIREQRVADRVAIAHVGTQPFDETLVVPGRGALERVTRGFGRGDRHLDAIVSWCPYPELDPAVARPGADLHARSPSGSPSSESALASGRRNSAPSGGSASVNDQ